MKRIAAPMVGGLFTSFLLELLVYPVLYQLIKSRRMQPNPGVRQVLPSLGSDASTPFTLATQEAFASRSGATFGKSGRWF
jgi:hypothetical protein